MKLRKLIYICIDFVESYVFTLVKLKVPSKLTSIYLLERLLIYEKP